MRGRRPLIQVLVLAAIGAGLGGCDTVSGWFSSDKPKLPGERISVLALESTLEPEQRVQDLEVVLPEPYVNLAWPQAGGTAQAAMQHLSLPAGLTQAWSADIGSGADTGERIVARPVVADGRIYTMDPRARVSAFDTATGRQVWRTGLARRSEDLGEIGGGLAIGEGRLVASTAYGDVFSLELDTGRYHWKATVDGPIRGAPTIANNRVYVVASENRLKALDIENGQEVWQHQGIIEAAELVGTPPPSVSGPFVIAPYSSGEIYALRTDTGQALWSDQLVRARRITPLGSINDVDGQPVIDGERVYAIAQGGYLAAYDLRRGNRIWDQDMAGRQTPWIVGDFVYVITSESELVCLSARDGGIRWVTQMPKYKDEEDKRGRITWTGPVLAGDRLIIAGDEGTIWSMSPYDGSALGRIRVSGGVTVPPIVAGNSLYVVTTKGKLIAWR
ncbi:MAG: PQQ-binding-like beta-propeller repeat protein [Pseudomonadota bacterium]|nr:PQQ-binding-like beta-propeller repeat protein [Pseudomonadota bacterium]